MLTTPTKQGKNPFNQNMVAKWFWDLSSQTGLQSVIYKLETWFSGTALVGVNGAYTSMDTRLFILSNKIWG